MSDQLDVVTVGELLGVISAFHLNAPLESSTLLEKSTGGSEVNVALGLARLGHRVGWAGAVGDDPFGREGVKLLRGAGVDVSRVVVSPSAPTGIYFKQLLALSGLRNYPYRDTSAARMMEATDVDVDYLLSGRVLHLTGITASISPSGHRLVRDLMTRSRSGPVHVSFDANLRSNLLRGRDPVSLLAPLAREADTVFLSRTEAASLFSTADPEGLQSLLPQMRVTTMITHDSQGAHAVTRDGIHWVAARTVQPVDPTGAGDAFVVGYLHGLLAEAPIAVRLELAEHCAAQTVSTRGDSAVTLALPTESPSSADTVDER